MTRRAWGIGLATISDLDGSVLDAWYPELGLGEPSSTGPWAIPADLAALETQDPDRRTSRRAAQTTVDLDSPPTDARDAYLRLHLLSSRLVQPNTINLEGIFGVLSNVVWTSAGPCHPRDFERTRAALLARHPALTIDGVDKFPRMVDYVIPEGVRIADASRVRLGAHLAPGTTVMHAGFVNFNAGSLGVAMIEGRVSQGVVIGDGTDIGGGASIMGTLSGGGLERVRIGERTLLGANAGLGISLGDDCVVEAGLYLTAGTKVRVVGELPGDIGRSAAARLASSGSDAVSARELSGISGVLFRRNSLTGAVEVMPRRPRSVELNAALHSQ